MGRPTVKTIVGNRIAPWYLDRYLAKTGYEAQQTDEPEDPNRPDNLFGPVDDEEDRGAHGDFDDRARSWSPQMWATTHRNWLALAGGASAALAGAALLLRRRDVV